VGALPTPLVAATDYFAIRTATTTVKLATTLANAHAGTAIDITSAGTGVHTITMSLVTRALGEHVGEEAHSQKGDEGGPHIHGITDPGHFHQLTNILHFVGGSYNAFSNTADPQTVTTDTKTTGITINSAGTGTPANIVQPSSFLNAMIKL